MLVAVAPVIAIAPVPLHDAKAAPALTVGGDDQLTTRVVFTAFVPEQVPEPNTVNVAVNEPAAEEAGVNTHCDGSVG